MAVVRPISAWALPAGFAYSARDDRISNAAGLEIHNPEDYWAVDYIYLTPTEDSADRRVMSAAGVVPAGQIAVNILAADIPAVQNAYAVQIGDEWYDVVEVAHNPLGVTSLWAVVTL